MQDSMITSEGKRKHLALKIREVKAFQKLPAGRRYEINCIDKRGGHYNPHERIEYIGRQSEWKISEDAAIRRIEQGQNCFYTLVNGREAEVIVATHKGRKYLKTDADGYKPDNLLALPDCMYCEVIDF